MALIYNLFKLLSCCHVYELGTTSLILGKEMIKKNKDDSVGTSTWTNFKPESRTMNSQIDINLSFQINTLP
jgi:hypothetical protein